MEIKIIKNLNKYDKDLVEKLIGCNFIVIKKNNDDSIIIDICEGLKLEKGEYEILN